MWLAGGTLVAGYIIGLVTYMTSMSTVALNTHGFCRHINSGMIEHSIRQFQMIRRNYTNSTMRRFTALPPTPGARVNIHDKTSVVRMVAGRSPDVGVVWILLFLLLLIVIVLFLLHLFEFELLEKRIGLLKEQDWSLGGKRLFFRCWCTWCRLPVCSETRGGDIGFVACTTDEWTLIVMESPETWTVLIQKIRLKENYIFF